MASRPQGTPPDPTARLLGHSPAIQALRAQIRHLAAFDTLGNPHVPTLLLQGETGTGKGLGGAGHPRQWPAGRRPLRGRQLCRHPGDAAGGRTLRLRGGAFSDAKRAKPGLFEAASGGTLFLDEIDALPLALQGKLLTVLEEKRVRRLGAVREQAVDVKLIAAAQTELGAARARRAISGRPVPPAGGRRPDTSPVARPRRGRPGAGAGLCAALCRGASGAPQAVEPGGGGVAAGLPLAGQRAGAQPSAGARDALERRAGHRRRHAGASVPAPGGAQPSPGTMAASTSDQLPADEAARIRQALQQTRGQCGTGGPPARGEPRGPALPHAALWARPPPRGTSPSPRPSRAEAAASPPDACEDAPPPAAVPVPAPVWEQKPVVVLAIDLDLPRLPLSPRPRRSNPGPWPTAGSTLSGRRCEGSAGSSSSACPRCSSSPSACPRRSSSCPSGRCKRP